MPEDGSAVAEGGTNVPEDRTVTLDSGSGVTDCFCEYPLGIKSYLKFKNKPMGPIADVPEI